LDVEVVVVKARARREVSLSQLRGDNRDRKESKCVER
jgi:hypothetical protein